MTGKPDDERDAERAFAVLEQGGNAMLPMSAGYSAMECAAVKTIFEAKQRTPPKLNTTQQPSG